MKRILVLSIAFVLLLAIVGSGTVGSFNDTEASTDNQLMFNWSTSPFYFYVVNSSSGGSQDKVFVYNANGEWMDNLSFLLDGANNRPSGAATVGDYVYILDQTEMRVYRYHITGGTPAVSKQLMKPDGTSALSNARGLAIRDGQLWVTRYGSTIPILYCYSLALAFSGSDPTINPYYWISPPIPGNEDPTGLSIGYYYLYVLDNVDKKIYAYPRYGGLRFVSGELRAHDGSALDFPNGMMCDGSSVWVVDSGTDMVYQYPLHTLFLPASTVTANSEFPLDSTNNNATGM